ncbi:MAG: HAMP domain-containing protein [Anaerolineae bacterium]|nr:HAMP domain-containing protein [Anaerolineae bacterium]
MKSILKRFFTLRWKLVFSYVGVTLVTILAVEIAVVLLMMGFGEEIVQFWESQSALMSARELAQLLVEPLEHQDDDQLEQVINQSLGLILTFTVNTGTNAEGDGQIWNSQARVVVDAAGLVVTSNQPRNYPNGSQFHETELPLAEALVEEARASKQSIYRHFGEVDVHIVTVPIIDASGELLGILYYQQNSLYLTGLEPGSLATSLSIATLALLPCIIPLGLVFGFVTATGFTRRLRRLTQASTVLASGDLSQRVHDMSGDEIGQLTRQFNQMAEQLEADTTQLHELIEKNARLAQQAQRLAALEERHRLARDLHDGIKQNLFGVNLAASAALNLLEADLEAARTKIQEAKDHNRQAQAEMQALLDELRPVGLDERGLAAALTDYLDTFEQRQGIEVDWQTVPDVLLPPTHEQALFRVTQEALTNIARHAQATHVTVELGATAETVTLRIVDNGRGFDPSTIEPGTTMGLLGMRERVTELGGALIIDSTPGVGTQLTASLPRPADES